jgi:hypothetical protein
MTDSGARFFNSSMGDVASFTAGHFPLGDCSFFNCVLLSMMQPQALSRQECRPIPNGWQLSQDKQITTSQSR